MSLSRTTGRIATLSLLSVLLALVAYDERLSPTRTLQGAVFYNCYSCTPDSQCQLQVVHERVQGESPCAFLGLQTSCAAACKCPSGSWPCEANQCSAEFKRYEKWISHQPNIAEGFVGSVFDRDHYLYFVPYKNDNGPHGVVWRYDTRGALNSQPSWGVFDPSSNGLSAAARGFSGGAFDGRYIYFAPNENASGPSGAVMRYDTTKNMTAVTSWELFDPSASGLGAAAKGFNGAVFDGNYVYFVPHVNASGGHNNVLRYNVSKPFDSASSWELFNPKSAASTKKGYAGAIYDGRYVYFIPSGQPTAGASSAAPSASPSGNSCGNGICDSNETGAAVDCMPGAQSQVCKALFCPQDCLQAQVPSVPTTASVLTGQVTGKPAGSSNMHGDVLRYDTRAPFASATSWTTFDPSANGVGSNARGYHGGVFDGTYIYFSPYINSSGPHGEVLRYNTKQSFTTASSWAVFNVSASGIDADAKGYIGAAFDGQFVYFAPYYNGKTYHGKALRYDTKGAYNDKLSWTVYEIGTATKPVTSSGSTTGRYRLFTATSNLSWMDAEASCVSKGGHLASILSQADVEAAIAAADYKTNVWIGLNDRVTEGEYKWTNGSPFSYTNWEGGQPNGVGIDNGVAANDCTFFNHTTTGKWHDVGCDDPAYQTPYYLCEFAATSSKSSAASSAASVTLGNGGTFGITGANVTVNADGSITMPSGGSATVSHNCSVVIDVPPGYTTNGITCELKNGAGTSLFPPGSDARHRNAGSFTVTSTTAQTFSFSCDYTLYNSISSYPHNVCSISIPVKISTSTCVRPPECIGKDIDKLWDPITCSCI